MSLVLSEAIESDGRSAIAVQIYFSDNAYLNSAQTLKYVSEENAAIKAILTELGLARQL